MGLDELTLTIGLCRSCKTIIIASRTQKKDFTDEEKATINSIAEQCGKKVRWKQRSILDWAHVHLEE